MINRESINGAFITSTIAIVLAAIVVLVSVPSVFSAMFSRTGRAVDPTERIVRLTEEHQELTQQYKQQFAGRSAFFLPQPRVVERPRPEPRPAPPPAVEVEEPEEEPEPQEPPPPATYQGPPIIYVLGNEVVFRRSSGENVMLRIRVGEEREGLRVLESHPPRYVRVAYERGEYDVPIFDWAMPGLASAASGAGTIPGLIIPDPASGPGSYRSTEHYERISGTGARGVTTTPVPSRPTPGGRPVASPRDREPIRPATPQRGRGR